MKITKIELQKKSPRFNLYIDNAFSFSISATTLTHHNLYKDKELKENELEDIKNKETENRFFDRVVSLLSSHQKTEKQVRDYLFTLYLKKKGKWFDDIISKDELFEIIINRVKRVGLINDEEYGRNFVLSRIKNKPRGSSQIISELLIKGIDRGIANKVVAELVPSNEEMIERVFKKKFKEDILDIKNKKQVSFLLRKGFDFDDISKLERQLKNDTKE